MSVQIEPLSLSAFPPPPSAHAYGFSALVQVFEAIACVYIRAPTAVRADTYALFMKVGEMVMEGCRAAARSCHHNLIVRRKKLRNVFVFSTLRGSGSAEAHNMAG